jgi:hypothetical protein
MPFPTSLPASILVSFLAPLLSAFVLSGCSADRDGGSNADLPPTDDLVEGLTSYQVCQSGHSYTIGEFVEDLVAPDYDQVITDQTVAVLECYASAPDCTELLGCALCQAGDTWCDGDVAMRCELGAPVGQDCGAMGMTCLINGDVALCAEDFCQGYQESCEGYDRVVCDGTTIYRTDCADSNIVNGACAMIGAEATCVTGPLTTCDDATFEVHCEGDVAVFCENDSVIQIDCTLNEYRTRCIPEPEGDWPICVAPGTCTDDDEECVGTVLRLCVGGSMVEFDCSSIGATCSDSGNPGCTTPM